MSATLTAGDVHPAAMSPVGEASDHSAAVMGSERYLSFVLRGETFALPILTAATRRFSSSQVYCHWPSPSMLPFRSWVNWVVSAGRFTVVWAWAVVGSAAVRVTVSVLSPAGRANPFAVQSAFRKTVAA